MNQTMNVDNFKFGFIFLAHHALCRLDAFYRSIILGAVTEKPPRKQKKFMLEVEFPNKPMPKTPTTRTLKLY